MRLGVILGCVAIAGAASCARSLDDGASAGGPLRAGIDPTLPVSAIERPSPTATPLPATCVTETTSSPSGARTWLDAGFGDSGALEFEGPPVRVVSAIATTDDGVLLLGTRQDPTSGSDVSGLLFRRLNADGTADDGYGCAGWTGLPLAGAGGLALRGRSAILVGADPLTDLTTVVRVNDAGAIDPTFGESGAARVDGTPRAAALDRNERIVIATTDESGLPWTSRIHRLSTGGTLDPSFGTDGIVTLPNGVLAAVLAVDDHGRVVVGGWSPRSGSGSSAQRWTFVRLLPSGLLDPTFGVHGVTTLPVGTGLEAGIASVRILGDGRIAATAWATRNDAAADWIRTALVVLGTNGRMGDPATGVFPLPDDVPLTIVDAHPGRLLLSGVASGPELKLVALHDDGTIDSSFGAGGFKTFAQEVPLLAGSPSMTSDGGIVAVAFYDTCGDPAYCSFIQSHAFVVKFANEN